MKNDSQIQADVLLELKFNPSITHEHIGALVSNGIVTLSGTVPSYIEKLAAEKAVKRVAGVKAIIEKVEVELKGMHQKDDGDIAEAVLSHFKWNIQVPDSLIKIKVESGWVQLSGEVEWNYQRAEAERCVRALSGIKGVVNNITLKSKNVQPEAIRQKIEEAFSREADRDAKKINIDIHGGKVTLSGTVRSYAEMDGARHAAWNTAGVTNVENNMRVTDY